MDFLIQKFNFSIVKTQDLCYVFIHYTCMLSHSKKSLIVGNSRSSNVKRGHACTCKMGNLKCPNQWIKNMITSSKPLKDSIFLYYMSSGKCANYADTEQEREHL